MHLHTRHSFDCLTDPVALVKAMTAHRLDRICITDHNEIATARVLKERYPEQVIVGEEVRTAEGVDVIGLFLTQHIPKGTPARETCERIREQGGIVYVPHPFAGGKGGGGRILSVIEDLVDAVEGFNARLHDPALNRRAAEWGRARGMPLGAGSDGHTLAELGRGTVTLPPFDDEPAAFLHSLRHGTIDGVTSSPAVHIASTWAKLHKRIFPRARAGLTGATHRT